jgi:PAS domain S-box-containing protein
MQEKSPKTLALTLPRPSAEVLDTPPLDELLGSLYEHVPSGVCCSRIIFNGEQPVDRLYLYTNPAYLTQTGLDNLVGKLVSEVRPNGEADHDLLVRLARVATTGESDVFEYLDRSSGKWFSVAAYSPVAGHVVKVVDNITERKRLESERENYRQVLERKVEDQVQDLRESEERFRGLFEKLPIGIIIQAANGEIIDVNMAACNILHITMDEFAGMTGLDSAWNPVHEDGSPFPAEEHPAMVAIATGKPQQGVLMGVGDANDRTWISISSQPLYRPTHPIPYAALSSFLDVTSRVRDNQFIGILNSHYLDLLASSAETAVIGTDLNGVVTLFNPGAQRMLGYSADEVVGHAAPGEFWPPSPTGVAALESAVKLGTPSDGLYPSRTTGAQEDNFQREMTYLRKDGSKVRASVCITPVRTARGEVTGHYAVIQDIGDRERP